MKKVFVTLSAVLSFGGAQQAFAECRAIETPAGCEYSSADPVRHATCIRNAGPTNVQLGGMVALPNGNLLAVGGVDSSPLRTKTAVVARAFIYDIKAKSLCETSPMLVARNQGFSPILLGDGKVLVAGGWTSHDAVSDAEIFDPATESWSRVGSLPVKLAYYDIELQANGSPVISGGSIPGRRGKTMAPNLADFTFDTQLRVFSK